MAYAIMIIYSVIMGLLHYFISPVFGTIWIYSVLATWAVAVLAIIIRIEREKQ